MQLRVYRSLLGSSLSASSSIASSLASSLATSKGSKSKYDGVVLTMDQLMELKLPVANRTTISGDRNHTRLRLICQLEPACADDASDQLVRLADHLRSYDGNNNTTNQQQQYPEPLQLDMVVVRTPSSVLLEHTPDDTETATCLLEYLSSTLPVASQFLESIPPGSVHQIGRSNAHGNPLGQHIHGVTHHLTTTAPTTDINTTTATPPPPPVHLEQLSEIADIFPPTRFALDPTNLGSGNRTYTDGATTTANGHSSPASSGAHGLSRELEGVVQNTDLLRVSPSTFQPPPLACTSNEGESRTNSHSDSDCDDPFPHGLFGAGTLFGEIWAAQELEGVRETYVICDQDNHDLTNSNTDDVTSNTTTSCTNPKIDALAAKIQRAFDETEDWRAGAKQRREEEVEAAAADAAARRSKEGWLQGRYGPHAIESARVLGLLDDTVDDDDDDALDTTLTKERIQRRWRTIAFQNHPDTADKSIPAGGKDSRNHLPFDVLKQHFQTLMEAVRHDDK